MLKKAYWKVIKLTLNKNAIQQAQALINMGLEHKRALEETIDDLIKIKKKLTGIPMIYILFILFIHLSLACSVATASK